MVNSTSNFRLDVLSTTLPQIVTAANSYLSNQLEDQISRVKGRLELTMSRLREWQVEARAVADAMSPGPHQTRRREDIDRVTRRIEALVDENRPATSPLIRIVGALIPRGGN
jgi:hypothetical protein